MREMITAWVKEKARTPVMVKLTPNISDIRVIARAAKRGGADAAVGDQHDQFDHRHRSGHVGAAAQCRRQSLRMAATAGRR